MKNGIKLYTERILITNSIWNIIIVAQIVIIHHGKKDAKAGPITSKYLFTNLDDGHATIGGL